MMQGGVALKRPDQKGVQPPCGRGMKDKALNLSESKNRRILRLPSPARGRVMQGPNVVNLGGLTAGGVLRIPLSVISSGRFTFSTLNKLITVAVDKPRRR